MKSLDEIGIAHGTDKASVFTRTYAKPHGYLRHVERFFEPLRNEPIRLLEIGVGGGESIRTWLEYFPNALICGIDIVHSTNEWNTPGLSTNGRYEFTQGDQSSPEFWNQFIQEKGTVLDVVIDDGSHMSKDVIRTFNSLWKQVKSGGLYIIEDLGCAYSPIFLTPGWPSPIDVLNELVNAMHAGSGDIDSLSWSRELAILRKK